VIGRNVLDKMIITMGSGQRPANGTKKWLQNINVLSNLRTNVLCHNPEFNSAFLRKEPASGCPSTPTTIRANKRKHIAHLT
jgi:hypothetical protein